MLSMFRRKEKPFGRYSKSEDTYVGRMVADGSGHLIAEEGPQRGQFVAWDHDREGFVTVPKGTQTHNARHHLAFAHVVPTEELQ